MKPLQLLNSSLSNLVPLHPKNRLTPNEGYSTLLDDWLARSPSHHTIRMYRTNINAFFQAVAESDCTPDLLAQFLSLDGANAFSLVSQYHGSLVAQRLAPATINQKLAAIKSLVNYANQSGKCHYTLTNIKAMKLTPYRDTKGIDKELYRAILAAVDTSTIKGIRDRAILLLMWGNALRRSEVVTPNIKDYLPALRQLRIVGKGKSNQAELITLGSGTIKAIDFWLEARGETNPSEPLFCAIHKSYYGHRLNTNSIYKLVQKYAKSAEIDKTMSPHRIRHSSITEALNLTNGDVRAVQKLSRHSNLNTLMIYDDNRQDLQGKVTGLLDDLF
ncbi:MAG: tyrosine-type recombinase/integrase [Xenococcaceae cyanobacterium]